jgi:hypothetical protein
MAMLHWSFINNDHKREVLNGWTSGGCMETIRRNLGYRLVLKEASLPFAVKAGETLILDIRLSNEGFAAMYNPRPVYLVLLREGTRYAIPIAGADPRRWAPGRADNQCQGQPAGEYLAWNIPIGSLASGYVQLITKFPAYAVRFANTDVGIPLRNQYPPPA